jgi:hypothetical protein
VAAAAAPIALLRAGISATICASEGSAPLLYTHIRIFSLSLSITPSKALVFERAPHHNAAAVRHSRVDGAQRSHTHKFELERPF